MAYTPLTREQYNNAIKSGFTPQQIINMEKKRKAQNAEKPQGYFQRVAGEYKKAAQDIFSGVQSGADTALKGAQKGGVAGEFQAIGGLLRGALRTVGGVAEATFAPITEAPIIKQGLEAVGTVISKVPGVDLIVQKATELAQKHPESAKDLKNIIDIATLGVGKEIQKPLGIAAKKAGVSLEKSGLKTIEETKNKFIQDLVKPIETKAEKIAQVARTSEKGAGIFKRSVVAPTQQELKMAQEVAKISGLSEKKTLQQNFNIVRDFNVKTAEQLKSDIKTYDFIVPKKELLSRLDVAAKTLNKNPLIVGDAEKTASRLIVGAKKVIQENEGKGSGVLQARKDYDDWVLSQKPKAFDATAENAFTIANREIRQTINNFLDEKAPNLGIKDSLRQQATLYDAMENIAQRAAQEANTAIGRTMQRVGQALGTKNKIVQGIAAAAGIGGLGAAATFAPAAAIIGGGGYLLYRGGRLILKPEIRVAIGKLLQASGKMLGAEERTALQGMLDSYAEAKKTPEAGFLRLGGGGLNKEGKALEELMQWTHAEPGQKAIRFSKETIEYLSKFKPKKPVSLYKGVERGEPVLMDSPTSWTYSKEIAKEHTYGEGKVLKKTFLPNQVLVDSTEMPSKLKRAAGFFDDEEEVIIKESNISLVPFEKINLSDEILIAQKDVKKGRLSFSNLPVLAKRMPDGTFDIIDGKHRVVQQYNQGKRYYKAMTNEKEYRRLSEEEEKRLVRVRNHSRSGFNVKEYTRRPQA